MSEWQDIETAPKDGRLVLVGLWYDGMFLFVEPARREPYSGDYRESSGKRRLIRTANCWLPIPDKFESGSQAANEQPA